MLDLSELKVGDRVQSLFSNAAREVTAVGRESFVYWNGAYESHTAELNLWTKVEPPLIDPEQVYFINDINNLIHAENRLGVSCQGDLAKIRITSYEVVK